MTLLGTLLADAMSKRDASYRDVAKAINVSPSTVGRIIRGDTIDLQTLEKICSWIGIDPGDVLDASEADKAKLGDQIEALLKSHPQLYEALERAVELIMAGEISPETLREIVAFINFRLQMDRGGGEELFLRKQEEHIVDR